VRVVTWPGNWSFSALLHSEADEIAQVEALLAGTDLTGMVITGDAAHAQHATAAHLATERGGHYALTVKGNQPGLLAQIAAVQPPAAPGTGHHVEEDRSKGRIVRRAIWIAPAGGIDFPGAAQVFRIRRDTFDHRGNRLSKEGVHGVTSLKATQATAAQVAGLVRNIGGLRIAATGSVTSSSRKTPSTPTPAQAPTLWPLSETSLSDYCAWQASRRSNAPGTHRR
jgi:hypothetical protein